MRRAMMCVGFMLAMVELWPVVFGHSDSGNPVMEAQFVPSARAAGRSLTPARLRASPIGMPTCYQRYERAYNACRPGDGACRLQMGDNWDVCEATGFWPE